MLCVFVEGVDKAPMQNRGAHILVVDDDPLNRRLLVTSLERDGHRTTPVEDGESALAALRTDQPDLVLLDIVMPGIDGIEVLSRIKADDAVRHVPVIMISGLEDSTSVVRCLELGADDFLPKPFDPAILRARINAGLTRKALYDLERERVREMFARFVPEPLVDEVLARTDGQPRIQPELLTGTVLFSDLRGFTAFSEGRPVDEVIGALNRYHSPMTDAILDHGGTLVSYMGDGIMAAFGAPVPMADHADRALTAAQEMVGVHLGAFNRWLRGAGFDETFRMGIGINSGPLMSGSVGSSRRLDYTVIGDTTNTASRIESMTKETDYSILFSGQTKDALRGVPGGAASLGEFEIRGRRAKVALWGLAPKEAEV